MTTEIFIKIASAVLSVMAVIITSFVVPYIKTKFDDNLLNGFVEVIVFAVRYAEQKYTVEEWKEKKLFVEQYVSNVFNEKFKGLELSPTDIDVIIESVVNEIKYSNEYTKG